MTDIEGPLQNQSSTSQTQSTQQDDDYDGGNSTARLFERTRIQVLADERGNVQKKTFTKWVNSHLTRVGFRITDLYMDLRDGRMLIKLLEVLSCEDLPKPTRGKMRIHCLENVDKAITFLHEQQVHLENIGAHDIVDGNPSLTLGLIWTIILRFQIQDITFETVESKETRSAKDALLLWCQIKTADYPNVHVKNFTTSWKDGLAFNALIHKHRPDLINYQQLNKSNATHNLNNAFQVAEKRLGLSRLLDAEDVTVEYPDEKSIITYVATYYHYFSKMKQDSVQGKRIAKVVSSAIDIENDIARYETLTSNLLEWIRAKIQELSDRRFQNSLQGVQQQLAEFNEYRISEKAEKFKEKGNLEMLLFTIQSKLRANNQKCYLPKEGKLISDINKEWSLLEKEEHQRELALREEIVRQENLEQLATKYNKKAAMRKKWLNDSQKLVISDQFGFDLESIEAAFKKQEAIQTDIGAFENRVRNVCDIAQVLEDERYHDIEKINATKRNVIMLWDYLLELVNSRRQRLDLYYNLHKIFQDMNVVGDGLNDIKTRLKSEDLGKTYTGIEDLIQRHRLIESDIDIIRERVERVCGDAIQFSSITQQQQQQRLEQQQPTDTSIAFEDGENRNKQTTTVIHKAYEPELIEKRVDELKKSLDEVQHLAEQRKQKLEEARKYWKFIDDTAEEELWINEKIHQLSIPTDTTSFAAALQQKNLPNIIDNEMNAHLALQLNKLTEEGEQLINENNYGSSKIDARINDLREKWKYLEDLVNEKQNQLNNIQIGQLYYNDCDDLDSYMIAKERLITHIDEPELVDKDEIIILNLIKKQKELQDDFDKCKDNVENMKQQSSRLSYLDDKNKELVDERLRTLDRRYKETNELLNMKKQNLQDALSVVRLNNDIDGVQEWIDEKEKFLATLDPTQVKDIEELEVIKHRFDGFERDMNATASKVGVVNQLARQLLQQQESKIVDVDQQQPPYIQNINERINLINQKWSNLRKLVDKKRDDLNSTFGVQTFLIESNETISWIQDKIRVVQSTEQLGTDLAGVMTMQRKLTGLERDMAAIQSKLDQLNTQAETLEKDHPKEASEIKEKVSQINDVWVDLKDILKKREESMGEAAELQKFLRDLDHFSAWLTKTQTIVASGDPPTTLSEAEQLLNQHQIIKEEIDRYGPDYFEMKKYGEEVIKNADNTDPQYRFLNERLIALNKGWDDLDKMWSQKQMMLSEALNYQVFDRDAKQAEVLLNNQEYYLARQEQPKTLEDAENLIRKHEDFLTSTKANEDKIEGVKQFASRLCEEKHYAADQILDKAKEVDNRFTNNKQKAIDLLDSLRNQLEFFQYLQDCDELKEWLETKQIEAQDDTYRDTKNIHTKYLRHKTFEAEVQSNKNRLDELEKHSEKLLNERGDLKDDINKRVSELKNNWIELEIAIKEKGERLFDANRSILYEQSVDALDGWIKDMEKHIETSNKFDDSDLTTTNILLEKQRDIEQQLKAKQKQVEELQEQAQQLKATEPERSDDIENKRITIQDRFSRILQPLEEQKKILLQNKRVKQFLRDCDDEKQWIDEKSQLAQSQDYGNSLASVKMLQRKNDALQIDVDNHEPRIQQVCNDGEEMIQEGNPRAEEFKNNIGDLIEKWQNLKQDIQDRRKKLLEAEKIQQYLFDCSEAEAWMGEQELYMMSDEKSKDEQGAQLQLKKHQQIENSIEDHAVQIKELGDTSKRLLADNEDNEIVKEIINKKQMQIDKLYAGLKDLSLERRQYLEETVKLFLLNSDIDDLEQWIADKETVANSQELGIDFEHVNLLKDRFQQFSIDTQQIGQERINEVNDKSNLLIDSGHKDAATIAEWKDNLNSAWSDLLELIDTRAQMLQASWELHKFYSDCKEVLSNIEEKKNSIPEDTGRDAQSVQQLQRKHAAFENDLLTLGGQVHQIREEAAKLLNAYAGDKAKEIQNKEEEVLNEWRNLQSLIDIRKRQLADTGDLYKFFNMARDLMMWIDDILRIMKNDYKPADVSGVELLINNHQSLKAEIDARSENITICLNLGKDLVNRPKLTRANEVKEKCIQLCLRRDQMNDQWDDRWIDLQLMLEVYQYSRDATIAEQWLIAQEPYLRSEQLGESLEEVELLLKKHEAIEKSLFAQEERFNALRKLTTLELKQKEPPPQPKESRLPIYQEEFKTLQERELDLRKQQQTALEEEKRLTSEQEKQIKEKTDVIDASKRVSQEGTPGPSKIESQDVPKFEGILQRKHEWETVNRKASNRSWNQFYCVFNNKRFDLFKDQKHYKSNKVAESIDLDGATAEQATDYKKKDHVFRLRLANGGQYLMKAKDDDEMNLWIQRINSTLSQNNDNINKTKSLPPPDKRTQTTSSLTTSTGGAGTTSSLKKDFSKKQ